MASRASPLLRKTRPRFPPESKRRCKRWTAFRSSGGAQLHGLIRVDSQSPERLGALVRGYANLGLLTEFHWHPAHKALAARSLVYVQRMVFSDKQPARALWHRAYAFALAGLHQQALDDLQAAGKQGKSWAEDRPQPPGLGGSDRRLLSFCQRTARRSDPARVRIGTWPCCSGSTALTTAATRPRRSSAALQVVGQASRLLTLLHASSGWAA